MSNGFETSLGRRLLQSGVALLLVGGLSATPAAADELISVGTDTILWAESGTRIRVADVTVDPAHVGRTCTLTVLSHNQVSVHVGNDLIVTTNGFETVIEDVEAAPNETVDMSTDVTVGETIAIDLLMGPDRISSLGFDLSLDCAPIAAVVLPPQAECPPPVDAPVEPGGEPIADPDPVEPAETDGEPVTCPPESVPEPEPIQEMPQDVLPAVPTVDPVPCPEASAGSLTVVPDCPVPDLDPEPAPEPEPTVEPAAPAQEQPTVSAPATPEPEVLGIQVERLAPTPAAAPVIGTPTYTG